MKSNLPISTLLLIVSFLFSTKILFAQQNPVVQLTGAKMRVPLEVVTGKTDVDLCGLTPGNTYTVLANGAVQGQQTVFALEPSALQSNGARQLAQQQPSRENAVRFTATAECFTLTVKVSDAQQAATVPMFLSVKCETCPEADAWKKNLLNTAGAAVLQVQDGQSAESLISNVLIDGDCFDVDNVTFAGNSSQIGTFSNGATNIGFDAGVIIGTGDINIAPGPNDQDNANGGFGNAAFDSDLSQITGSGSLFDRANIEFDFTPTESPVSFQFVFASEEYCEYVGSQFNDVFGFFISGPGITGTQNLAVLPSSNVPVTINTINHITNSGFYVNNQPSSSANLCGQSPATPPETIELQYDGFTQQLFAIANVIPCETYHIKLKIADVGDGIFDSAVFLKGGSFSAGGDATVDFVVNGDPDLSQVSEGCGTAQLVFDRVGSNQGQPLPVTFAIGGTATPGVDYAALNPVYVIPAGQDQLVVPVTIFTDFLTEGAETIVLTLDNPCSCDSPQVTLTIVDYIDSISISLDSIVAICTGGSATLTANPQGGVAPYTFEWSTMEFTPSITVSPSVTTTYYVTVTDACDASAIDSVTVIVGLLIETTDTLTFCPGGSVVVGDTTYTDPGVVIITVPGMNGQCDTIATYILELLPINTLNDTIALCPGGSVTIGDSTYFAPDIVEITFPGMNGECDTIATYVLELLPQPTFTETIAFCPGGSVTIGDSVYTQPGTVIDTLPGINGQCDTIATYILELLPFTTFTDSISFCPGTSVTINGEVYTQPGTVVDTLPGMNGQCDTIATYVLEWLPLITFTQTIKFCPGETVIINGVPYTQPGTVVDTLPGSGGQCDTIATYILELLPQVAFTETIDFCPGETVVINGVPYTQPGTVLDTLPGSGGQCDTLATYVLNLLPQVSFTDSIAFCPGETVTINGVPYTQAGTVLDTLPGSGGQCDTLATYILVSLTPAPSIVTLNCPADFTVNTEPAVGTYAPPVPTSDCVCPGISLQLTGGLPSGSVFPGGVTQVCYLAKDSCGNTAACCFNVTVPDEEPCSQATIGCVKYELYTIHKNAAGHKTYRIRVTNNCTNKLMYAAFELPLGVVALAPANNSVYTAPSGREYTVRNPNYAPFYSIRFKSSAAGMANGESDLFEFTLPTSANPAHIQVVVRVEPKIFYSAYLHTINCPVETVSRPIAQAEEAALDREVAGGENLPSLRVFPNPTSGVFYADLSDWHGEQVQVQIVDSRGQRVQQLSLTADAAPQEFALANNLPNGLYFIEILSQNGEKQVARFVLQR